MNGWKALLITSLGVIIVTVSLMLWEQRSFTTSPAAGAAFTDAVTIPNLFPGGAPPATLPDPASTHYEFSGADISEGKRLWSWFNCVGCHSNGGGGIGPALMDDKWIYGAEPRNIYASILEGRPNGMPSFRGKIPDDQVWKLVAYVRSMAGLTPSAARSSRNDTMSAKQAETLAPKQGTNPTGKPAAQEGQTKQ